MMLNWVPAWTLLKVSAALFSGLQALLTTVCRLRII